MQHDASPPDPSHPGLPWGEMHLRLLEQLAPPSVLVNAEHEMLHLSPGAGRFLQFSGGEPSRSLLRLVHPDLRPGLRAALYQASRSHETVAMPAVPVALADGTVGVTLRVTPAREVMAGLMLVSFQAGPPDAAAPGPQAAGLIAQPVSHALEEEIDRLRSQLRESLRQLGESQAELQAVRQALRRVNARFRAIVDQATVGVLLLDPRGRIAFVNGHLCRLLGDAQEQLLGTALERLIHPDDLAAHRQRLHRLQERGGSYEIEKRLLRRDGSVVWVHSSVTTLPADAGGEASVIAVCVDISERRRTEAALRSSEEHLRRVLENAREYAIFTTDTERRITGWNLGAERLLGYTEQEALGRSADMIFTDEDRAARVPQREAIIALEEARAGDDRFHRRKDGSLFWASGMLMRMHDGDGRPVGFVKILRDQTEARQAQQALERGRVELLQALRDKEAARAALEAANAAKDQFLAVLSHELRTPLTPAVMALQLLSRRKDMPEEAQESLRLIHRNIRVESRLIDDLLDLTRISRGTLQLDHEPVDLHQIIRSACEICEPDLREKSQELTLALQAPLHRIMGDGHRLQQVVWNLLKNAAKFTPAQGHIEIRTAVEDGRFSMAITDDGVGIDADTLPRIFDAFVQGGAWVAREYGGLGLGLAISRATIEAHGGRIRVSSPGRGQGATFILELPLAEP